MPPLQPIFQDFYPECIWAYKDLKGKLFQTRYKDKIPLQDQKTKKELINEVSELNLLQSL